MAQLSCLSVSLVTGADGRWHPGIGDPSVVGWVTVVAYFAAACLAVRAVFLHSRSVVDTADSPAAYQTRLLQRFWLMVLLALLVLGVNKQLDLQTYFTEVGRDLSKSQNWYEGRRRVQYLFILAIASLGAVGTMALAYVMRSILWRVLGALFGLGALVTFVIIRAASFHHVDVLLGRGRVRLNWVLELGGIALIAISAFRQRRRVPSSRARPSAYYDD